MLNGKDGDLPSWCLSANETLHRSWILFTLSFSFLYGIALIDFYDFTILSGNLLSLHPIEYRQFLHSSPFTFVLGAALGRIGIAPSISYLLICIGGFVALLFSMMSYLRHLAFREEVAAIILSTPLLLTLTFWVGKSDPYILALYLCALKIRFPAVQALCVTGMVFCHRDIAAVMLICHCLTRRSIDPWLIAGLILGELAVLYYHFALLPHPPASRMKFVIENPDLLARNAINPIAHLVMTFGWGWFFVARALWEQEVRMRIFPPILVCFVVALAALDYTRVFILCAFPVLLYVAETQAEAFRFARRGRLGMVTPAIFLIQFHLIYGDRVADLNWAKLLLKS